MILSLTQCAADLKSDTCRCGAAKQPKQALCHEHYWKLDPISRRRLYLRIGHGFEIAYTQALRKLGLLSGSC